MEVRIELGARRQDREQTRLICRVVIDGERRGRLSLTRAEAEELIRMLERYPRKLLSTELDKTG